MPGPYVNQTMSVRRAGRRVYEYVKKAYPETTLNSALDSATSVTLATGRPRLARQNSYVMIGARLKLRAYGRRLTVEALSLNHCFCTRYGAKVYLD